MWLWAVGTSQRARLLQILASSRQAICSRIVFGKTWRPHVPQRDAGVQFTSASSQVHFAFAKGILLTKRIVGCGRGLTVPALTVKQRWGLSSWMQASLLSQASCL